MAGGNGRSPTGRRVVLFPFPSGSHTTPMLQLAALLRVRGLGVTVLHADLNAPNPARHPELTFVSIRESLPDEVAASPDPAERMLGLNAACEAPFQAALNDLVRRGGAGGEPVACAVVDAQWYRMLGAARRAGIPALAVGADSAAAFLAMLAAPRPRAGGDATRAADRLDEVVPGLEPLRVRDLIGVDGGDTALRFTASIAGAVRDASSGVVLDTFDAIEGPELASIRRELSSRPVFVVGPLHLAAGPPAEQQQPATDGGCLAWLDARPPRSVLYVSLGGAARVDRAAFEEMAWGLAGSGVTFLWELRPGSVRGDGDGDVPPFPEELHETVRRRGRVVARSPAQGAVLAHPAVGGFWTHGGWSSVVEAVCEGVPMLVHPCLAADRAASARRWGVGLEAGRAVERTAMARAIRRLMARAEHGPQQAPRERARLLRMQARECVAEGGPASLAMDGLVEFILGL